MGAPRGFAGFGSASISDILTSLKQLVVATNGIVDGLGALAPHYTSGRIISATLVQSGFVRVTGVSVISAGTGIGKLFDAANVPAAISATTVYPVSAALGYYPVNMIFQNGLVYVPAAAQAATIFYART